MKIGASLTFSTLLLPAVFVWIGFPVAAGPVPAAPATAPAAAAGAGGFTDVTKESGLDAVIDAHYRHEPKWWLSGTNLVDLDGDGHLDLFLGAHGQAGGRGPQRRPGPLPVRRALAREVRQTPAHRNPPRSRHRQRRPGQPSNDLPGRRRAVVPQRLDAGYAAVRADGVHRRAGPGERADRRRPRRQARLGPRGREDGRHRRSNSATARAASAAAAASRPRRNLPPSPSISTATATSTSSSSSAATTTSTPATPAS